MILYIQRLLQFWFSWGFEISKIVLIIQPTLQGIEILFTKIVVLF